jgi:hypothetical protein
MGNITEELVFKYWCVGSKNDLELTRKEEDLASFLFGYKNVEKYHLNY